MAMTLEQYNQQYAAYGLETVTLFQNSVVPGYMMEVGVYSLKKVTNDLNGKLVAWNISFVNKYGDSSPEYAVFQEWLNTNVTDAYKLTNPNTVLNISFVQGIKDAFNFTSILNDSPYFTDINLFISDIAPFISACIMPWKNYSTYKVNYDANTNQHWALELKIETFFAQAVSDGVIPPPTDMAYSYSFGNLLWHKFIDVVNAGTFGPTRTIVLPGLPFLTDKFTEYPIPVLPINQSPPPPPETQPVDAISIVTLPPPIDSSALTALVPPPPTVDLSNYVAPPVETVTSTGEFDTTGIDMSPTSTVPITYSYPPEHPMASDYVAPTGWPSVIAQMTADGTIKLDGTAVKVVEKITPIVMTTVMESQNIMRGNAFLTPPDAPLTLSRVRVLMTPSAQDILVMKQTDDYRFGRISPPVFEMSIFKGKKGEVGPSELTPIASTKTMLRGATPETIPHTYFIFDNPVLLDVDSKYFWVIQATAPQIKTTKTPVYDNVAQQLNTVVSTETTWPKLILHVAHDNPVDGATVISRDGGQTWKSSSLSYSPWELWGFYVSPQVAAQVNQSQFVPAEITPQQNLMDYNLFAIPLDSTTPMPVFSLSTSHEAEPGQVSAITPSQTNKPAIPAQQSSMLLWGAAAAALLLLSRRD